MACRADILIFKENAFYFSCTGKQTLFSNKNKKSDEYKGLA